MRRVAVGAAISLATLTVATLLWRFRGAAGLFVLSLTAAATVRPFVDLLEPRLGRTGALVVVYASGLALLGVFATLVTHGSLGELDDAVERFGAAYDRLRTRSGLSGPVHRFFLGGLPPAASVYRAIGGARPALLLDEAFGVTRNAIDLAGQFLIGVALSAYWSGSRESFERLWLSIVPAPRRPRARMVWRGVEQAVGAHLRSEIAQSVLGVLLLAIVFRVARLPTPMLPALAAGFLRLVPGFGPLLAGAGAFLAGAPLGIATGALAAAYTVVVVVGLDRGVAQRLFRARRPSPTLVVFMVVGLVDVYGPLGLLLASPLATAVQVYVERVIATHPRRARPPHSLVAIGRRLEQVRRRLAILPATDATQLESVVARLGTLTADARRPDATARPSRSRA